MSTAPVADLPHSSASDTHDTGREPSRTGLDPHNVRHGFLQHVRYSRGKNPETATAHDRFMALSLAVRDRLTERWVRTSRTYYEQNSKRSYYLSAEYLLGRALGNNLINIGMYEAAEQAMREVGVDLTTLIEMEPDAGLGNGGLGRLAACFLDSLATLGYPGMGYGIRYEFGIFTQRCASLSLTASDRAMKRSCAVAVSGFLPRE